MKATGCLLRHGGSRLGAAFHGPTPEVVVFAAQPPSGRRCRFHAEMRCLAELILADRKNDVCKNVEHLFKVQADVVV